MVERDVLDEIRTAAEEGDRVLDVNLAPAARGAARKGRGGGRTPGGVPWTRQTEGQPVHTSPTRTPLLSASGKLKYLCTYKDVEGGPPKEGWLDSHRIVVLQLKRKDLSPAEQARGEALVRKLREYLLPLAESGCVFVDEIQEWVCLLGFDADGALVAQGDDAQVHACFHVCLDCGNTMLATMGAPPQTLSSSITCARSSHRSRCQYRGTWGPFVRRPHGVAGSLYRPKRPVYTFCDKCGGGYLDRQDERLLHAASCTAELLAVNNPPGNLEVWSPARPRQGEELPDDVPCAQDWFPASCGAISARKLKEPIGAEEEPMGTEEALRLAEEEGLTLEPATPHSYRSGNMTGYASVAKDPSRGWKKRFHVSDRRVYVPGRFSSAAEAALALARAHAAAAAGRQENEEQAGDDPSRPALCHMPVRPWPLRIASQCDLAASAAEIGFNGAHRWRC